MLYNHTWHKQTFCTAKNYFMSGNFLGIYRWYDDNCNFDWEKHLDPSVFPTHSFCFVLVHLPNFQHKAESWERGQAGGGWGKGWKCLGWRTVEIKRCGGILFGEGEYCTSVIYISDIYQSTYWFLCCGLWASWSSKGFHIIVWGRGLKPWSSLSSHVRS